MTTSSLTADVQWMLVERVWDSHRDCIDCPHKETYPDRWDEPGGSECTLIFNSVIFGSKPDPTLCPGYGRELDKYEKEQENV